jgi:hypothetical protein
MWRRVDLVWTDVWEERIASIFRVEKSACEKPAWTGGWFNLHPPAHVGFSRSDFSTLMMEAICSSETSVHTGSARRHVPEGGILCSHRRENLKSYIISIMLGTSALSAAFMSFSPLQRFHHRCRCSMSVTAVFLEFIFLPSSDLCCLLWMTFKIILYLDVLVQGPFSLRGIIKCYCRWRYRWWRRWRALLLFTGRLFISAFVVSARRKESLPLLEAVEMVVVGNASVLDFLDGAIAASGWARW